MVDDTGTVSEGADTAVVIIKARCWHKRRQSHNYKHKYLYSNKHKHKHKNRRDKLRRFLIALGNISSCLTSLTRSKLKVCNNFSFRPLPTMVSGLNTNTTLERRLLITSPQYGQLNYLQREPFPIYTYTNSNSI